MQSIRSFMLCFCRWRWHNEKGEFASRGPFYDQNDNKCEEPQPSLNLLRNMGRR